MAYALLQGEAVRKVFVDTKSDLSTWLQGNPTTCELTTTIEGLPKGTYQWAVALVDVTRGNTPALEMAVDEQLLQNGWLLLNKVKIK